MPAVSQGRLATVNMSGGAIRTFAAKLYERSNPPPSNEAVGAMLWVLISLVATVGFAAFYMAGFRNVNVDWVGHLQTALIMLIVYLSARRFSIRCIQFFINGCAQYGVVTLAAVMLTYAAATLSRPLIDQQLLQIDQALGYDWRGYARFFKSADWLTDLVKVFYSLIFFLPSFVILMLALRQNVRDLERFVLTTMISLVLTIVIFALFPATTAWAYQHVDDAEVRALGLLTSSENWIGELLQIRSNNMRTMIDFQSRGLIAFPSFHCAAALLFVWATWRTFWLRAPMLLANLGMLIATPLAGGHYLADLLGGAVVVMLSVVTGTWIHAWMITMTSRFRDILVPDVAVVTRNT